MSDFDLNLRTMIVKLTGLKNGQLLAAAESIGFEVLITVDRGIPYQQNVAARGIAVLVLCVPGIVLATCGS